MKYIFALPILLLFVNSVSSAQSDAKGFPKLSGPYLGQKPPGKVPEIFAPFLEQEGFNCVSCSFSPDGKEFLYTLSPLRGSTSTAKKGIYNYYLKARDGIWSKPEEFLSSQNIIFRYPSFTKDGKRLILNSTGAETKEYKIPRSAMWQSERTESGWSAPKEIIFGNGMNGVAAVYPSSAANGNLFFASFEKDNKSYIYMSKNDNGHYSAPERLAGYININSGNHPYIAPDESYIIFDSEIESNSSGKSDLFISFRGNDDKWLKPVNLGEKTNTDLDERRAFVSDDGKYLFFVSDRNDKTNSGIRNYYWVDASFIEDLRKEALKDNK
ncbi:MAG: hypothetical protein KKG99_01075 [Bacteroidetes bacterium]|nr:hypothetical protein [Bacteroidota bacterium]